MTQRAEYTAKMKHQLDELNAKITQIETRAVAAKEDAADKYREEMGKLRQHSKATLAKLGEMNAAGDDLWQAMVADMEVKRDAFKHSFNYFKSQL